MRWRTIAIVWLGLAALSASAQVHRCKNASGKIVYGDQPCALGQAGGAILPDPSVREIAWEQARARALGAGNANSVPCRRAREELGQLTGVRTLSPEEKRIRVQAQETRVAAACGAEPSAASPPAAASKAQAASGAVVITYCDGGVCHDNKGGVHMKSGPDLVDAATGKKCARVGTQTICT